MDYYYESKDLLHTQYKIKSQTISNIFDIKPVIVWRIANLDFLLQDKDSPESGIEIPLHIYN